MGDGRGFRHAIALADQDAGEGAEAVRELGRKRSCSALDPAKMVSLGKIAGLGGLTERIHGRRHERHSGNAFFDY